jgi:predicted transposase/invertase (TIGR01784 family)
MQVEEIKKAAEKIGVKKGIKKGKKEGKFEMAKNLKENGVDISLIAKSAGLLKEEIEKLYTYKFPNIKTPSLSFH